MMRGLRTLLAIVTVTAVWIAIAPLWAQFAFLVVAFVGSKLLEAWIYERACALGKEKEAKALGLRRGWPWTK